MSDTTATRRQGEYRFHAAMTTLVMTGALALSYNGITSAIRPIAGGLAWLYAVTLDLSMLVALREVTRKYAVARGWAWAVLVLAGGASLGLNTWHALDAAGGKVPIPAAVAFGAGPVALAALLSHLVALQAARAAGGGHTAAAPARTETHEPLRDWRDTASDRPTHHGIQRPSNAGDGVDGATSGTTGSPTVPRRQPYRDAERASADDDDAVIRYAAIEAARHALRNGQRLTGVQLAAQFDRSESWGRARLREARSTGDTGRADTAPKHDDITGTADLAVPDRNDPQRQHDTAEAVA